VCDEEERVCRLHPAVADSARFKRLTWCRSLGDLNVIDARKQPVWLFYEGAALAPDLVCWEGHRAALHPAAVDCMLHVLV
jgi:hypothetical protein